jgi:segregation and condensation protein B
MIEDNQEYEEIATQAEDSLTAQTGDNQSDAQSNSQSDFQSDEGFDEQALAEILAEDELIEEEFLSSNIAEGIAEGIAEDAEEGVEERAEEDVEERAEEGEDAEDEETEEIELIESEPASKPAAESLNGTSEDFSGAGDDEIKATRDELKPVIEALLFVADEPLPFKQLCKILGDIAEEDVTWALGELVADYEQRGSGLEAREIAGGWRISTRPQYHEFIRKYLKSRPSARLSLPALETLAVIAYKQPITIPEILEIRGVTSSSAVKTLLEKRLIVTKGRKETVGRPMMYGTSKEFLIQFGLKDLSELPSIEDFEDLAQ